MRPSFKINLMASIYAGSTPKYFLKIKDSSGTQLDPENAAQVLDVIIFIYNASTGDIIAKFYLNTLPEGSDWTMMTVKTITAGDKRVQFYLTSEQTEQAAGANTVIQVNLHFADTDAPDNTKINIKRAKFHEIKPAKTV